MSKSDLLQGPVAPVLIKTSVPTTVGAIAMILYYLADTWFVSLLGTQELAALGFTFPATILFTYLGVGLSIGTSAMVARAAGARDENKTCEMCFASIVFAIMTGLLIIGPAIVLINPMFSLMGADPVTLNLIRAYLIVMFIGVPFQLVQFSGTAVIRALGNAQLHGRLMMISAALNALLDPLLIFGWGPIPAFGISGAAIATVITWGIANVFILYYLLVQEKLLKLLWPGFGKLLKDWQMLLKISLPAALANMITPVATGIITATLAKYGAETVAAFGVVSRLEALILIVVLGMSMSLPPFISQNFGADALDRVREALRLSFRFVLVLQIFLAVIVAMSATFIAGIFTDEAGVQEVIITILYILPVSYAFQGIVVLTASSFNALHVPGKALSTSLLRFFVFYVPLALIGAYLADIKGLFIGAAIGNFLAGITVCWWILNYTKSLQQPQTDTDTAIV